MAVQPMASAPRGAFILFAFALTISAASHAGPGFVQVLPDGKRTLFTTQVLKAGDEVTVQFAGPGGRPRCCEMLKVVKAGPAPKHVTDQQDSQPVHAYELPASSQVGGEAFLGAGWAGADRRAARQPQPVVCTSSEGAHLLMLKDGRPAAHLSMDLGHAVRPNCDHRLLSRFD